MQRRIHWSLMAAGLALAACSDSSTAPTPPDTSKPGVSASAVHSATYTDRAALLAAGPSLAYTTQPSMTGAR